MKLMQLIYIILLFVFYKINDTKIFIDKGIENMYIVVIIEE